MELLYSGSFYSLRGPSLLVEAVLAVPCIRLSIASGNLPTWLLNEARAHPNKLRLLGRVPYRQLLGLQRPADVLVNLANSDSIQVPGKFYEYLGAGRPILHVGASKRDVAGILLESLHRGWAIAGTKDGIINALDHLRLLHEAGGLNAGLDVSAGYVSQWSWSTIAAGLESTLNAVLARAVSSSK